MEQEKLLIETLHARRRHNTVRKTTEKYVKYKQIKEFQLTGKGKSLTNMEVRGIHNLANPASNAVENSNDSRQTYNKVVCIRCIHGYWIVLQMPPLCGRIPCKKL